MLISILSSFLWGTSLARIISDFIINKTKFNLFNSDLISSIPGFSLQDSINKTYDTVYVSSALILSVLLSLLYLVWVNMLKHEADRDLRIAYLIFAVLLFFETHFVSYSGLRALTVFAIAQLLFFLAFFIPQNEKNKKDFFVYANGLFMGFYLLIVSNLYTMSFSIPLGLFISGPFIFAAFSKYKFFKTPFFPLLVLSAFFPFNKLYLALTGICVIALALLLKANWQKYALPMSKIYTAILIFMVVYNPLFYFGNFDSIEEGFWLGWWERIMNNQVPYRDFFAYHPPLLLWGLDLSGKILGQSIYTLRAYLHILQIIGLTVIYFVLDRSLKNNILKVLSFLIILALLTTGVRNNVEIRLGMGLLSLLPVYGCIKENKSNYLIASGILSGLSFFTSIEVGVASIASIGLFLLLLNIKNIKSLLTAGLRYLVGLVLVFLPMGLYFFVTDSLISFAGQMLYYIKVFSQGYLSSSVDWPQNLTLLQWHVVNRFFSSATFLWYLIIFSLAGTLIILIGKIIRGTLNSDEKFVLLISIFSLFMLRPVLGRSDSYHLLFELPLTLILFSYLLEETLKNKVYVQYFVIVLLGLFFLREPTQLSLLQPQLVKLQTYGNAEGQYPTYRSLRTGILPNIDTDTAKYDLMIDYIKQNSSKEDTIFAYPALPEIYFLADRQNATKIDTPLAYFTPQYQDQMINELKTNNVKMIIYRPNENLSNLNAGSLPILNTYLKENFIEKTDFGDYKILVPTNNILLLQSFK